ncbi:hypothetical protein HOP50_03g25520 [Chloropicon primus]|uniref:Uncharacterized protein n=1 Tax=Chloropicon primus TaxID=1764295 RepID=A0A5B8MHV7_9CHLO|nr:hypothetical protein A3770_03p25510 [Chloropicon primus]UPQ99245.1 hypothetical protein HOP50_03g25520 [Chloropicon primus]|mmetsp:Transcript_9322/g.26513  ORF Transcript_9322/g.26513 Transcript_9322/m.26513 type:complete len:140 (-) Transcript_9322:419-838(-)|eukprot:QDZ20033.1 hypothetical protein A3770_03p25510 [Chloropicon primus]
MSGVQDLEVKEFYAQDWVAGVCGGGSGTNVHFTCNCGEDLQLERVYYKKGVANVQKKGNGSYVARFRGKANSFEEMERMRGLRDPDAEERRPRPPSPQVVIPCDISEGQAVITYKRGSQGEEGHFKVDRVEVRELIPYM